MDVDWCLSCDRKLDTLPSSSGPYCSPECLSYAQPQSSSNSIPAPQSVPVPNPYHIHQWAAAIPPHVPAGAPSSPFAEHLSHSPSQSHKSTSRFPSIRTPKLIKRTSATAPLPTLGVSLPTQFRPLPPSRTSHCAYPNGNTTPNTAASMSEASTSLTSLLSEPLVATPDETDRHFGITALVRSWVHRHHEHSKCRKQPVEDQDIKSYFPPLSSSNTTSPPRSKKSTMIQTSSPTRVLRKKSPATKLILSHARDRSTSTHSHRPTPVIFPSCRAAELDWDDDDDDDDDDDEDIILSQPHHNSHYQEKYQPQARSPSPSDSESSIGSSMLLMAPKRWDGVRGRRTDRVIAQ